MFGKNKKKKEEAQENELMNDTVDATDAAVELTEKKEETVVEEPTKKKRKLFTWDTFNVYKFIIEIIACVLLVALGFLILFNQSESQFAIFLITGGVPIVTIIIRGIILIKKKKEMQKNHIRLVLVEFLIEFLLAAAMIFAACMVIAARGDDADAAKKIRDWFNQSFPYWAAGIMYTASICYFIRTILFKVFSDKFKFWLNIVLITGTCVLLIFKDNITAIVLAIIIAVLAFLSAVVLGTDAGGGYYNYYKRSKAKEEEEKKKDEPTVEAPADDTHKDEEINDIDPNAIPKEEPSKENDIVS